MKLLLAVSGGIDSMCMANLLTANNTEGDSYAVAHCNFHLREEESDADACFVEQWCRERGLRCFRADFDTENYAEEKKISIEMAARELRYAWFARLCREEGFEAVAVAHNANDNAETLILNLLRGTGTKGIRGMSADSWNGVRVIRPLLGWTRTQIHDWMVSRGYSWREDRTNSENGYKRNKIRNEVFPVFESINPSFVRTLGEDMRRFSMVDDIAEDCFQQALKRVKSSDGEYKWAELKEHKHWPYILFRILEPYSFSEETLGKLAVLMESGRTLSGKVFESPGFLLHTSRNGFRISRRERPGACDTESAGSATDTDGQLTVTGAGILKSGDTALEISILERAEITSLKQPEGCIVFDAHALPFPFIIRKWRDGDWLSPLGMRGRKKKISDLLTDLHITGLDRGHAYILEAPHSPQASEETAEGTGRMPEKHVLALLGYRIDSRIAVTDSTEKIIRIRLSK